MRKQCLIALVFVGLIACDDTSGRSYARQIESPNELIGGPGALGAVGDYLIGNQKIRVIIQNEGWSRGFGIFGGGIIDADIVRPGDRNTSSWGKGYDNFGELFPALFFKAFEVESRLYPGSYGDKELAGIEIINDGSNGEAAVIRTRAAGGDFLTMLKDFMGLTIFEPGLSRMVLETDYILEPNTRHVTMIGRLVNATDEPFDFSGVNILRSLGTDVLHIPFGDVLMFGDGNDVYAPGGITNVSNPDVPRPTGFDLRYSRDESQAMQEASEVSLPAFFGLVTDFLATVNEHVSYGFAVANNERNFAWLNKSEYGKDKELDISKHSLLLPFASGSQTGVYYAVPPQTLAAGETFEFTKYLMLGDGDVASIREELYEIRGTKVAPFSGEVRDDSGTATNAVELHIFDANKHPYTHVKTEEGGRFKTSLEPGDYYYVVTAPGRHPYPKKEDRFKEATLFTVDPKNGAYLNIRIPRPGEFLIHVRDVQGRGLPAKVMLVADYDLSPECKQCTTDCSEICDPRNYLFELALKESRRHTDFNWWYGKPGQFIEKTLYSVNGVVQDKIRPGTYDIYVSRGLEYDLFIERDVVINAGERVQLNATLERTVDTSDYISVDFHVHSGRSLDSSMNLDDRVITGAGEGLEMIVSTDHNYIADYQPAIIRNNLGDWVSSMIGVELSTLEMGHFNAFPLEYDMTSASHFPFVDYCFESKSYKVNRTAFDWVECVPQKLFDNLRAMGAYGEEDTLVQVNHPRDATLGYFNQYYMNPYSAEPETPTVANYAEVANGMTPTNNDTNQFNKNNFSYDFDVLEVWNGKHFEQVHAFRIGEEAPQEFVDNKQDFCQGGHPNNDRGNILLQKGGYISYPGSVDDWMHLLNVGYQFTATGNSDSHGFNAEIGTPRNFVKIDRSAKNKRRDRYPGAVHELEIIKAVREHKVFMTNGPFLTISVVDGDTVHEMGSTVLFDSSQADEEITVNLILKSADWVDIDQILIYANGEVIETISVPPGSDDDGMIERTYIFDRDVYLVAEAMGSNNLFPVITPIEYAATFIGDFLGGVGGGLGTRGDGITSPGYRQYVTPYALTNPIWLDINANGKFDAPGNDPGTEPAPPVDCSEEKSANFSDNKMRGPLFLDPATTAIRNMPRWDIRKLFQHSHAH